MTNVFGGRQRPVSLHDTVKTFLNRDDCKALLDQIVGMSTGGGSTSIAIRTSATRSATWALNRMHFTSDVFGAKLSITRQINGAYGQIATTRLDAPGLAHAIQRAEQQLHAGTESPERRSDYFDYEPTLTPVLWSDDTGNTDAGMCTDLARKLIDPAEAAGMVSTGDIQVSSVGTAAFDTEGLARYYKTTEAQCSMTVRNPQGTASGWAGRNHYDLGKIGAEQLAACAVDKAQRSANPVAVEPGRYTTILEPQAMSDLFSPFLWLRGSLDPMYRPNNEIFRGPFLKVAGQSKISEEVIDSRITFRSDPTDPDGPFVPFDWGGTPYRPVNWIDRGVLKELWYPKQYALSLLRRESALPKPYGYRLMAAPGVATTTVEEMIAKTERGVLVTRLSGVSLADFPSMLMTGYTRDGVWLIEQGKVTRPIKNFRFNESPLFILNNLEDVGVPERVFSSQGYSYVAPAVRVRDFSFTALADAV